MTVQEKMTADDFRLLAKLAEERRAESIDRCDTDGFLSQFALSVQANEYRKWAELAENNYQDCFETLADLKGDLVPCRQIETKYGLAYGVYRTFEDAQNCGEIIKWVGLGKRAAKNKGYKIVVVSTEAKVVFGGGYTASVYTVPVNPVHTPENSVIIKEAK